MRSLRSQRMFEIVKVWSVVRFEFLVMLVIMFVLLVESCLEWIEVGCRLVDCWYVVWVVVSGLEVLA